MAQLGIGVMLGILGGNTETVEAVKSSLGKQIESVIIGGDALQFSFTDGTSLKLWDGGQSCCEHRYMECADDLTEFKGQKLVNISVKDAPDQQDEYGEVHQVQFLDVQTDKSFFQCSNHNEHNGYYGGFWIQASN